MLRNVEVDSSGEAAEDAPQKGSLGILFQSGGAGRSLSRKDCAQLGGSAQKTEPVKQTGRPVVSTGRVCCLPQATSGMCCSERCTSWKDRSESTWERLEGRGHRTLPSDTWMFAELRLW